MNSFKAIVLFAFEIIFLYSVLRIIFEELLLPENSGEASAYIWVLFWAIFLFGSLLYVGARLFVAKKNDLTQAVLMFVAFLYASNSILFLFMFRLTGLLIVLVMPTMLLSRLLVSTLILGTRRLKKS